MSRISTIPPRDTGSSGQPRSRIQLWSMRLIAATVVPLVVLCSLEVFLRVAGYGYSTRFFVPREIEGVDYLVPNREFTHQFFPVSLARSPLPSRMLAEKPEDTFRIFLFGGSAAYGDPDPSFGVGRHLEALLERRYPETDFEVVNVAVTAINSHVVLPIARDCAKRDADMWIVYMGNNEMVGPYGAGTIFGAKAPSVAFVRSALALKRTRIGQLLEAIVKAGSESSSDQGRWQGIDMFSENLLRDSDENRLRAYENFRRNLGDIIRTGQDAKVPVIVSTVASNLKDCSPFASLHSEGLKDGRLAEWESLFARGTELEKAASYSLALDSYLAAAEIDPDHAELQYRIGSCNLALGNSAKAMRAFTRARDHDALAVRADSRINQIIKDVTNAHEGKSVQLVDAVSAFEELTGIPGQETFYEHVHLTLEGNLSLAQILSVEVSGLLPESMLDSGTYSSPELERLACEQRLAVTMWDRKRIWNVALGRISVAPFTSQSSHPRNVEYFESRKREVDSLTDARTPARDLHIYQSALQDQPEDTLIRWNYAQFLEMTGSQNDAIKQGMIICQQLPDSPWPLYFVGSLLSREGRLSEAEQYLKMAIQSQPYFPVAERELEHILQQQ